MAELDPRGLRPKVAKSPDGVSMLFKRSSVCKIRVAVPVLMHVTIRPVVEYRDTDTDRRDDSSALLTICVPLLCCDVN